MGGLCRPTDAKAPIAARCEYASRAVPASYTTALKRFRHSTNCSPQTQRPPTHHVEMTLFDFWPATHRDRTVVQSRS